MGLERVNIKSLNSLVLIFATIACITVVWFVQKDPVKAIDVSLPGLDNRPDKSDASDEKIVIGELFAEFESSYTEFSESWPRFRGENFDNQSSSPVALLDKFDGKVPDVLWSHELGEGHAGAAIYKGLVYVLDYDEDKKADLLRCFALDNGTELWQRGYGVNIKRNHGMSRTVPAVTEDYILTIGPRLHVMCLKRESGEMIWGLDVEKKYFTETPFWYTGQCPLIDDNKAIIGVGGNVLMVAVDCATGDVLWETPNEHGFKMSHSSVMPFTFNGKKMYVYSTVGGICGISAEGDDVGQLLWYSTAWNHSVVAPSPVCMPDGRIFLSAGYGAGSMMIQLVNKNNGFDVQVLQEYSPKEGLACEQQTPLFFEGKLVGIQPKDAGAMRNQMVCVDPKDCTSILWTSGKDSRFGLGPYYMADGKIYILSDDATLTIAKATTKQYVELDNIQLFEGHDAWAPIALANGLMVLRDSKKMVCLDMRKK